MLKACLFTLDAVIDHNNKAWDTVNTVHGFDDFIKRVKCQAYSYRVLFTGLSRDTLSLFDGSIDFKKSFGGKVFCCPSGESPAFIRASLDKLKVHPIQCIMFAGSPETVEISNKLKIPCIGVNVRGDITPVHECIQIIKSFDQVNVIELAERHTSWY